MGTNKENGKDEAAKREAERSPGKDDVHEQREQGQRHEGVVSRAPAIDKPRPPRRSKR